MRLHRFYIAPDVCELSHEVWMRSEELRNQWLKVFRYRTEDEVVLFDGIAKERLYKITQIEPDAIKVEMVTEFERKLPAKHIYLFWSLLKKDKNEWVIQKCTELGVSNFVPIIAERSEKLGFDTERAEKIAIEAAEQCGRSDIPHIREPISLSEALSEYSGKVDMLFCDEPNPSTIYPLQSTKNPLGIFIGPEGGWTKKELELFKNANLGSLNLGNLTLRAETAAIAATTKLLSFD
jgi:16S rRNA (uracil1498-N3)-methyltransferase